MCWGIERACVVAEPGCCGANAFLRAGWKARIGREWRTAWRGGLQAETVGVEELEDAEGSEEGNDE